MCADRLRRLDYWIGVPVCACLTLWLAALRRVRRDTEPREPARVLFIELAEMGAAVLAYPAMSAVRRRFPHSEIYFLSFTHVAPSVRLLGIVPDGHVLTINASSTWCLFRDSIKFCVTARRLRIDAVINCETFTRGSALLAAASGASTRVGFDRFHQEGLYTGNLLTHRVAYNPHLHIWQSMWALAHALDSPAGPEPQAKVVPPTKPALPRLVSPPSRLRAMRARLSTPTDAGPIVVINANASRLIPLRRWPLERFAELVARLIEDPDVRCVLIGSASETADAETIVRRASNSRVIDLTGQTTVEELIDLFNVADVLVTNDSGPAHLAALTPIDIVAIFGPETPAIFRPLSDRATVLYAGLGCSPCVSAFNQRRSSCTDNQCVKVIDVGFVANATQNILAQSRHARTAR